MKNLLSKLRLSPTNHPTFPKNDSGDGYKVKTSSGVEITLPDGLNSHSQFVLIREDGILDEQGNTHRLPWMPLGYLFNLTQRSLEQARKVQDQFTKPDQKATVTFTDNLVRSHEIVGQSVGQAICIELKNIEEGNPSRKSIL